MSNASQPFDPGYDYEADRDIVERLEVAPTVTLPASEAMLPVAAAIRQMMLERSEAAGEIRALRIKVRIFDKRVDELRNTLDNLCGPDWEMHE